MEASERPTLRRQTTVRERLTRGLSRVGNNFNCVCASDSAYLLSMLTIFVVVCVSLYNLTTKSAEQALYFRELLFTVMGFITGRLQKPHKPQKSSDAQTSNNRNNESP